MILASRELHPPDLEGGSRAQRKRELRVVSSNAPTPEVNRPVILLADDDKGQRLLYRHCLEREGYQVVEAEDGRQCLELFVTERPDVVLLDAVMPEMNGFDCCSEIKQLDGDQETPVLMITGLDDQISVDRAFTAGAADYVTKPIHWAVLLKRLHRLIESSHAQRALWEQRSRQQHSLEREQALIRVIQGIRQSLDLETIFSTAVQEIGGLFHVERAMILRYQAGNALWTVKADYSSQPGDLQALGREFFDEQNTWIEGLRALRYLYHEDVHLWQNHPGLEQIAEEFPGSWLQLPLMLPSLPFPKGLWGCLVLVAPRYHIWSLEDKRSLDTLTAQLIIAIHQAQLVGDLETLNRDLEQKVGERTAQLETQIKHLRRIDGLKDEFISRVSRELRTPLTTFKMGTTLLTQVLQAESLGRREKVDAYLDILRTECEREIKLVDDLLEMQQLEAGIHPDRWEWIDLQEWLQGITQEFETRISHQHSLQVMISADLPQILTLPDLLRGVLQELMDNACKYTPTEETILIRARLQSEHLFLGVLSTGVEIPPADLPLLFDQFYQSPQGERQQSRSGAGLGLALAKARVLILKGDLEVVSRSHQTEVTIRLPLQPTL